MTIYSDLAPLLRRFVPYLKEVRGRWIAAACLLAAGPALSACLLWSVKILVDDVFVGHAFEQLPLLIAIYLAITVGKVAVSYASTRLDASIIVFGGVWDFDTGIAGTDSTQGWHGHLFPYTLGADRVSVRADSFLITVGIVYSIL